MRIISVTNQKGGCGKTTTAVNLAASLALNGRRVLLIDLDPQAHATLGLEISNELSIYNVLSKLTDKKVSLEDIIQNIGRNFDLAPSNIILSTLEQELANEIGREQRLWDILNNFRAIYDYIIIDCPPNLGILTVNAIRAAEEVIVPVEASRFSLEGLSQLMEILQLVRNRLLHEVKNKILVTNFDSRLQHSFTMFNKIKAAFGDNLFNTIVHVNVKLREAQNQGCHIFNYDKYSRGAKDYFSLSREIISVEPKIEPILQETMEKVLKEELPALRETVFNLRFPGAKDVYIVGDFNNWTPDENSRMQREERDAWKKKVALEPGRYHYRFVVDGKWVNDPNNPKKESNPFGDTNSLLEISHLDFM
jgi:chromosome partitioning protein